MGKCEGCTQQAFAAAGMTWHSAAATAGVAFPPTSEPTSVLGELDLQRTQVSLTQRQIIDFIWRRYYLGEPHTWPTTLEVQLEFGASETIEAIDALPSGSVRELDGSYAVGLQGLLLGRDGVRCEQYLVDLLSYMKGMAQRKALKSPLDSADIGRAYDMLDEELALLGQAIMFAVLHDGIEQLNGPQWRFKLPRDTVRIVEMDETNFRQFIATRARELATMPRKSPEPTVDPAQGAVVADPDPEAIALRQKLGGIVVTAEQLSVLESMLEAERNAPSGHRQPI